LTQRQKRDLAICSQVDCGLCKILRDLTEIGEAGKTSEMLNRENSIWHNVVFFSIVISNPIRTTHFAVSRSKICLAHEFTTETHGLTRLHKKHGISTLEDVCQRTRQEITDLYGVGVKTMEELDRLIERFGQKYKKPLQLELFGTETFPV